MTDKYWSNENPIIAIMRGYLDYTYQDVIEDMKETTAVRVFRDMQHRQITVESAIEIFHMLDEYIAEYIELSAKLDQWGNEVRPDTET